MSDKEREMLNRQIGVLSGLAWVALIDEKFRPVGECIDTVIEALEGLMEGAREK